MIGCLVNYNNTKAVVKAYNINDFPYERIKKPNHLIKECKGYIPHLMTFDIETSTIQKQDGSYEGFLYHWQVCIDGYVCFGRKWNELITFFRKTQRTMKNYYDNFKLMCYVHNFSYEFQFLYSWVELNEVFAIDKRKPLKAISHDFNIEFKQNSKIEQELKIEEYQNFDLKDLAQIYIINNPKEFENITVK